MSAKDISLFYEKPVLFQRALMTWYTSQNRLLPWRQHWQITRDPFGVWVSEIMLQQTLIKVVIPIYQRFMATFPTVQDLANASEDEVRREVRGLGYYRRFAFLHKGAKQIIEVSRHHGTQWPQSRDEWLRLPGIGTYTAAALSSICLGAPYAVLDGNVERVLCRLLDWREPIGTPSLKKRLAPIADSLLERQNPGDFNQAMMELGQLVCTKANPVCHECPVSMSCLAFKHGAQSLAPAPKMRRETVDVALRLVIFSRQKPRSNGSQVELLLSARGKENRFLKDSWGFPEDKILGVEREVANLGSFSHSITHHKISVNVAHIAAVTTESEAVLFNGKTRWVPLEEVEPQLVANLDRKALWLFEKQMAREAKGRSRIKSSPQHQSHQGSTM